MWNLISEAWCRKMHGEAMWPIHGKYTCPRCLREYAVSWEGQPQAAEYADPSLRAMGRRAASAPARMDICA